MKKNEVKKIEEEIKLKTTLPDDIKGKIRKEIEVKVEEKIDKINNSLKSF